MATGAPSPRLGPAYLRRGSAQCSNRSRRGPAHSSLSSRWSLLLLIIAQVVLWLPAPRRGTPECFQYHYKGKSGLGGSLVAHTRRALLPRPAGVAGHALAEAPAEDLTKFMIPPKRAPGMGVFAVMRAVSLFVWLMTLGLVFLPLIGLVFPFVKRRDPERRRMIDLFVRLWTRVLIWPFFKVQIDGMEKLPPSDQAVVYVANHQSFMDILSALHLPRSFKFISKASIFKIPLVGLAMKAADHVGLEREDRRSQVEVFRKSVRKLAAGASLFIYPEGTRSKDGVMLEFKKGAFSMAKRGKATVVPMTILGTGRIMPGGKEYFCYPSRPGTRIVIHDPISAEKVQEMSDADLMEQVRTVIESGLPEACRGPPRE